MDEIWNYAKDVRLETVTTAGGTIAALWVLSKLFRVGRSIGGLMIGTATAATGAVASASSEPKSKAQLLSRKRTVLNTMAATGLVSAGALAGLGIDQSSWALGLSGVGAVLGSLGAFGWAVHTEDERSKVG